MSFLLLSRLQSFGTPCELALNPKSAQSLKRYIPRGQGEYHFHPVARCNFFEFEDAAHKTMDTNTMDALPFRTCTLFSLTCTLHVLYMYVAFAYMYFTCIGRIKSGRSHGVNPNPKYLLTSRWSWSKIKKMSSVPSRPCGTGLDICSFWVPQRAQS